MKFKIHNHHAVFAAITLLYIIPILFFVSYSLRLLPRDKSWLVLSSGLLLIIFGSLSLILFFHYWKQVIQETLSDESQLSIFQEPKSPLYLTEKEKDKVTILNSHLNAGQSELIPQPPYDMSDKVENAQDTQSLLSHLEEQQAQQAKLMAELENKKKEAAELEEKNQQLLLKTNQIAQDFADYKIFSEEQLKQKTLQLTTYQQTTETQQTELVKREERIQQLDAKVNDLSYEIKTLIHLHESESNPFPPQSSMMKSEKDISFHQAMPDVFKPFSIPLREASYITSMDSQRGSFEHTSLTLKRCIHLAQKITGSSYYGEASRYRELSPHSAIDQRRLFDGLREEQENLVFVYSSKEQRVIFVNPQTKNLLGWTSDKFMQDFFILIQTDLQTWKEAVDRLESHAESQTRLTVKTRSGEERLMYCHLGQIPSGLFRHYVIGILHPC